jgi:para-aminobenzoate synthetase component II
MSKPLSILVVDNYDSFVYNLVQYLGELGAEVIVRRNDEVTARDIGGLEVDGVVISPGPGYPVSAGNCLSLVRACGESGVPLLGVCLGHQALAEEYGGRVVPAPELLHGRASLVEHDGLGVFRGVSNPLIVGRYHSLVVSDEELPEEFVVSARSNGLIMGVRHRDLAIEGVQFHPESVLTQDGYLILANWLETCGARNVVETARGLGQRADDIRSALPQPLH